MVRKLRYLEKVARDAAHKNAGAVMVIVAERQALHVREHVAPHIGLDEHAHLVPYDRYHIIQPRFQHICQHHHGHYREESGVELIREHDLHGVPRDIGKDEVYERYKERAEHIYPEQLFMPRDV